MNHPLSGRRLARILPSLSIALSPVTGAAPWQSLVSPAGMVEIKQDGKATASLVPGLFEVEWRFASMTEGRAGQAVEGGIHRGEIHAPGGSVVDVEMRAEAAGNGTRLDYRLTPRAGIRLNSLHVGLTLPASAWAGGGFEADGKTGTLPARFDKSGLHHGSIKSLRLATAGGGRLQLDFAQATSVLVQDDRQWGQTFTVRMGGDVDPSKPWPAGQTMALGFTLSGEGGMGLAHDGPVTIQAGPDWLPLEVSLDVEPGSALDFSRVIPREMPAGKSGAVIVNPQGHFAFARRPAQAVRFYGVNLCFSAHYLDHELADRLADRLWRLGYNALRIHHYEGELIERHDGPGIRLRPDKLDQLDYFFAALKKRGIYLTTDLFVSRPVSASVIHPDEKGNIGMDEYKVAVPVNQRAFEDFKAFSRALLDHVNPYTGTRYADDPALAWLSLINEGNSGNFIGSLKGGLRDDWQRAWNAWLAGRYKDRGALTAALGKLPDDQDPSKGNVPLQNVHAGSPAATVFNVFLAGIELDFFNRTRRFLREELGCKALLTNLNAWTNPAQLQGVRGTFDYVDDHFYVDHPKFLERSWSLPSSCPNTSPVAGGATGGRNCAFTRLFGKPFTITEFNYSSPGRFRGVGGILTGALGAVQDWDGLWRFAYAHNRNNISGAGPLNYFDVSADPLNQAAERASLCLFLRGDLQPAAHAVAISATTAQLLDSPDTSRDKSPPWNGLAWLARVGWSVDANTRPDTNSLTLPMTGGEINPFSADAAASLLGRFRERGWLPASNRSNPAANTFASANGQLTIDAPADILTLDTPRTAGGFAPAGRKIETGAASIEIMDTDATVWVSSLDQNAIPVSSRLLITHLTDLQNTGTRYAGLDRKVLLEWGRLPHLVQAGRARIILRLESPSAARVYGLTTDGRRTAEIPATASDQAGTLTIPLAVDAGGKARMLYEVEIKN
jgi:hypothetical protein